MCRNQCLRAWGHSELLARAEAMPAVDDPALVRPDRFELAVFRDVGDQRFELLLPHRREDPGDLVDRSCIMGILPMNLAACLRRSGHFPRFGRRLHGRDAHATKLAGARLLQTSGARRLPIVLFYNVGCAPGWYGDGPLALSQRMIAATVPISLRRQNHAQSAAGMPLAVEMVEMAGC